jgi:hypothetical protein
VTRTQLAEAMHVTTYWYRYPQTYVTLCNRVLKQKNIKYLRHNNENGD